VVEHDIVSATGLALATIASLIERPERVPMGEVARCLRLLADTASPDRPQQREILTRWAQLLEAAGTANERAVRRRRPASPLTVWVVMIA
jgi:hypothetical protein